MLDAENDSDIWTMPSVARIHLDPGPIAAGGHGGYSEGCWSDELWIIRDDVLRHRYRELAGVDEDDFEDL
ncbi:hypothetical protein GWI33_002659 [Rhynchophorus ferrugineus]|uniref:Uncharacterized protein n=1 Tax=Rhynchophorus ferrugineus TaxID=354439 RepID=A0A834IK58_RHYFE|nr:hypothetical protein GWI33_002659 [Rhynchophorus ferrugineus]